MAVDLVTTGVYEVPYVEDVLGGYAERWTPEGAEVVRRFRCRWERRLEFLDDVLGWVEPTVNATPPYNIFSRHLPMSDPDRPWLFAASATMVDWRGVAVQDLSGRMTVGLRPDDGSPPPDGDGTGWTTYDVVFRRLPYEVLPDDMIGDREVRRFVRKERKYAQEMLRLPGATVSWGATGDAGQPAGATVPASLDGQEIHEVITMPFGTVQWSYEQQFILNPNDEAISLRIGCVNESEFDGYFQPHTLLLSSAEAERMAHHGPVQLWRRKLVFTHRPRGWNKIFSRLEGAFLPVYRTADPTVGIFEEADFDDLFAASEAPT